jgi:hypothetical protein
MISRAYHDSLFMSRAPPVVSSRRTSLGQFDVRQTPTMDVVNRLARATGVILAEFFSPFDQPYSVRQRKPRRDHRANR